MPQRLPQFPYRLHVAPANAEGLLVAEFTAVESISQPFAFDILALWEGPMALEDLPGVGLPATLSLADSEMEDAPPRMVHGVLGRVKLDGMDYERGATWVRVRLVPRLALLKRTRRRRVFQDQTVVQIVDAVFAEHGVARRWSLDAAPAVIGYAVQYDESDLTFVHRLLARFGLFYYFEHPYAEAGSDESVETVVICERPNHYAAVARGGAREPLVIKLADRDGTFLPTESLQAFAFERRARPTATRSRDWEMRTPGVQRNGNAVSNLDPALGTERLVVDSYQQRNAADRIRVTPQDARTTLEQERAGAMVGTGQGDCQLFAPGHRFVVNNHDVAHLNVEWVLTRIEHRARVPELARDRRPNAAGVPPMYLNEFRCAPSQLAVRMPRTTRARVEVAESAIVVGPEGEEIYVDLFGRIKIQFQWDREGKNDDHSSCWVRVAQPWAGAGWGFQFIPRIGMEVLVTFVGGDADHPVVTGCLFNALQSPSHVLPEAKSRSGIRTRSTPGGGGANEIAFEDAAGQELLYVHASRDAQTVVTHDATRSVGNDESRAVVRHRHDSVGGNEARQVGGSRSTEIGGDDALTVGGDRFESVRGNENVTVTRDQTVRVDGSRLDFVAGHANQSVAMDRSTRVDGHDQLDAHHATSTVRNDRVDRIDGNYTLSVGRHDAKRGFVLHVEGATTLSSTEATEIRSTKPIVLRCGDSTLRIGPDGIDLHAAKVRLHGEGSTVLLGQKKVRVAADDGVIAKSEKITLKSSGASVKLTGDAKIDGSKVKLKAAADADDLDDASTEKTTIELVDHDGHPLAGQRYVIVLGDGSERAGVLDAQGKAAVYLDESAQVRFPDVVDVESA